MIYIGPRQRLAEPVHVRPAVHDQGRLRAQRHGRRTATTTTSTTASRTSRRSTSRPDAGHPAPPPLLRVGQLGAGRRRADASPIARQRADNYAAGVPQGPERRAVIADGHAGAERYLRALFTTHQSIEDMWRTMPNAERPLRQRSRRCRTPGVDGHLPGSRSRRRRGFYRSLAIGTIGVTTDEVISAGYGDTGANLDRPRPSPATPP